MGRARVVPSDPDTLLLPYQLAWIEDRALIKLMEKSRQIGMSWASAYAAVERTAMRGARHDQWVSSRDDIQARLFLQDCKMWAESLETVAADLGEVVIDPDRRISAHTIRLASSRHIYSMSSNPDAQAGKRGHRILDEFALHPDPRKLYTITEPGLTWGGTFEILSTHRGSKNFFADLIREIVEKNNPKGISHHRVTLEDALNQGFLHRLQCALPGTDPRQDMDEQMYFDWVRSKAADEESFAQEYMCVPGDDDAAFLEYDLIASAEYPEAFDFEQIQTGTLYAGVDIGRTRDLTVLWVVERLGDVLYTRHVSALRATRKGQQEDVLWPWFAQCHRTCIDRSGLGIGWVDDAEDRFGVRRIEGVTFTGPTKEALAYPVRGWMQDHRLRIPYDPMIRADLRSVTKTTTSSGNIRFTAERSADGHADHFWALALAIHAATTPAQIFEFDSVGPRPSTTIPPYY